MKILLGILIILFLYMIIQSPKGIGYIPTKEGSGGLKPNGGMREASMRREASMQYTALKYNPIHYDDYEPYIYDTHMIPDPVVFPVGHWSE